MIQTEHFNRRASQRNKSNAVVELLFAHGDVKEQKGNSYVLSLADGDQLHELQRQARQEADEARHQMLRLRRESKQSAIRALPMDPEMEERLHAAKRIFRRKKRELKTLRPAMLVCSNDKEGNATLITIGSLYKKTG